MTEIWARITGSEPHRMISIANGAIQEGGKAVILRMDTVGKWDDKIARFMAQSINGDTVASLRSRWQGGFFNGTEDEREQKLVALIDSDFTYVELEADLDAPVMRRLVARARKKDVKVVFFFNSFAGPLPAEALASMVESHYKPGDRYMIGAPIKTRMDLDLLLDSAKTLNSKGINTAAFGMGAYGHFVSILAPLANLPMVSAIPEVLSQKEHELHVVHELARQWESLPSSVQPDMEKLKLVGGLEYYKSASPLPMLYNLVLPGLDKVGGPASAFLPLEWGRRQVEDMIDLAIDMEFTGFHVCSQIQRPILDALDGVDRLAEIIQSVDLVKIKGEEMMGYNCRFHGYLGLCEEFPVSLTDLPVLVLGSGGEGSSAVAAFLKKGARVMFSSPNKRDEESAADIFEDALEIIPWGKRGKMASSADIIVAVPAAKIREPYVDPDALSGRKIFIDLQSRAVERPGLRERTGIIRFTETDMFPYTASKALDAWFGLDVGPEKIFQMLAKKDYGR
ncbi:MAG: type I 3-dehydroquinate dehydratase [Candidatus Thermoplasmatota archaeon]|nr:type I 3-dehydroquinate dehydratase [Candidatus Thermoplasmatota archaeon]